MEDLAKIEFDSGVARSELHPRIRFGSRRFGRGESFSFGDSVLPATERGASFLRGRPWAAKAMSRYSSIFQISTAVTGQYLSRRHVGDVSARAPPTTFPERR